MSKNILLVKITSSSLYNSTVLAQLVSKDTLLKSETWVPCTDTQVSNNKKENQFLK
jgi:hypothetical protein